LQDGRSGERPPSLNSTLTVKGAVIQPAAFGPGLGVKVALEGGVLSILTTAVPVHVVSLQSGGESAADGYEISQVRVRTPSVGTEMLLLLASIAVPQSLDAGVPALAVGLLHDHVTVTAAALTQVPQLPGLQAALTPPVAALATPGAAIAAAVAATASNNRRRVFDIRQ
jgi:hypothetical protein